MKSFSLYIPPDIELLEMGVKLRGWGKHTREELSAIQEDHVSTSSKYPIFAVADGVTLRARPGEKYPTPSGPGIVAEIFTRVAKEEAEKQYKGINEDEILEIFGAANKKIGDYNRKCGYTPDTVNYWDEDYYATTGALAVIKDMQLFWATLCDTRVAHLSSTGEVLFLSEDGYKYKEQNEPDNWDELSSKEQWLFIRERRNTIEHDGKKTGHGVLTGEEGAMEYIESGVREVESGDRVIVFSDGFTPYIEIDSVLEVLKSWPDGIDDVLRKTIDDFVSEGRKGISDKDKLFSFLYRYASERTIAGLEYGV